MLLTIGSKNISENNNQEYLVRNGCQKDAVVKDRKQLERDRNAKCSHMTHNVNKLTLQTTIREIEKKILFLNEE